MVNSIVSQSSRKKLTLNTKKRYANIRDMFDRLYHEDRKRIDDVEREIREHFGISDRTIERAMKSA